MWIISTCLELIFVYSKLQINLTKSYYFPINAAIKAIMVPENSDVLKIQPQQHNSLDRNEPSYDNVSLSLDFFKSDNNHYFVTGSS